jgi:hypothetical protein
MIENNQFPKDFGVVVPAGCSQCETPIDDCKGVDGPEMDGLHWFKNSWWCDPCLQRLGAEEFREKFSKTGAMRL